MKPQGKTSNSQENDIQPINTEISGEIYSPKNTPDNKQSSLDDQEPAKSEETESSLVANTTNINQDTANSNARDIEMSSSRLIFQIIAYSGLLIKTRRRSRKHVSYNWRIVVEALNNYNLKAKVTKVIWKAPDTGQIKIKTDPRRSSWVFCVRDEQGDILQAQAQEIGELACTNTQAEAMAILQALKFIEATQMDRVVIKTDSLLTKNIVDKSWKVPWQVVITLEEIWRLMQGRPVVIKHILREGNKLADHLANLALGKGTLCGSNFQEMEPQGRRIINSDKLKMPYLRIQVCRK